MCVKIEVTSDVQEMLDTAFKNVNFDKVGDLQMVIHCTGQWEITYIEKELVYSQAPNSDAEVLCQVKDLV